MDWIPLGHSGLRVSRLALGCMSFGDPGWRAWVLDEQAARPILRRAVDAGINFFDTADMYSRGVSEEITGRAIREYARREEVVVATKVYFRMGDGPHMGGLSRKHIVQACDASLRRLGLEAIDLYYIHRFDPDVPIEETLEALNHLVHQGKVRYLGASSGPAWRMARALSVSERNGWARFVAMQNHYNLVYREEEREMNPLCLDAGVGLVPWSPLARGVLARPRPEDRRTRSGGTRRAELDGYAEQLYDHPGDWEVVAAVEEVARERGVSMAEVALAWLLGRPGVVAPVIGTTRPAHLDAALGALDLVLTPEETERLESPYRPHAVRGYSPGEQR